MAIRISCFDRKHSSVVARLLNEEYGESSGFVPFDEERVLSEIRRRKIKVLVAEEDGEVVGLVGTHADEQGEDIHWLATHRGCNRKTVEDMLVKEAEQNCEGDAIATMIDEDSPKIKDWVSRGYTLEPGFQRMIAKLRGPTPVPEVEKGVTLRSLRPEEERNLVEAVNAGFGWQRLELGDLQKWKTEDPPFNEDWVQIAEAAGRIVSVVVAKPDTASNEYLHRNMGHLGPATTLAGFRNQHLASALTARAMNLLFERGMDSVRLGTSEENVASIALLRSLGFQVDNVRKILRKKLKNT